MLTFTDLEFHRHGVGLVPDPGTKGSAIQIQEGAMHRPLRSCTCPAASDTTCAHKKKLSRKIKAWRRHDAGSWEERFAATAWFQIARALNDAQPLAARDVEVGEARGEDGSWLRVSTGRGEPLASWSSDGGPRLRLLERLGKAPAEGPFVDRAALLERLALFQMLPDERRMNEMGVKTRRQSWEESFWCRLAYHCTREHHPAKARFQPAIDQETGDFTLAFHVAEDAAQEICRVIVPRRAVESVLKILARRFPDQEGLDIHPVPLQALLHVSKATALDLEVRPVIRMIQEGGEERFFTRDLERFTYGRLVYIPELGLLAQLERAGRERRFKAPVAMKLRRSQIPSFLDEHREQLAAGTVVFDRPLSHLEIFTDYDRLELEPVDGAAAPDPAERTWYHLSARYGFGKSEVTFGELLTARREGQPFLETPEGWIDLRAPVFDALEEFAGEDGEDTEVLRLTAGQLLRLEGQSAAPVRVAGRSRRKAVLERLLDGRPEAPRPVLAGLSTPLRPYQLLGVDWLRFLLENGFGGLLCDDMGLGKTHQAMALMLALLEESREAGPFVVICPTSVLSHWRNKIRDHAPGLRAAVHHGPERDLDAALEECDVVITSYGILRNDLEALERRTFHLAVFDEIQNLKNPGTLSYRAAEALPAGVKLGLTGTPIENSLGELKALFDLVLPGYLGADGAYRQRYEEGDDTRRRELRRLVSPFVLRRTKGAVLDELPEKIEDLRTCVLSDDQVKLYREALATRGRKLVAEIEASGERPLPYIHVFALLNLLKQICDHPALALRQLDRAEDYASGKWDLFCELLSEALDNGQKVVVFSQYLGMIELMRRHLDGLGVEHAILTGASRERGEIVDRFNEDPACRVFLGSLKAGGTGIDLVGGSVVVHYDRWWNAAREDQATDRVHRMGQKRAVQVLKLVTEGTLEERIAAIIERKRALAESVIDEDDHRLAKIFTRDELLELLRVES